jgi:hypothetical protein
MAEPRAFLSFDFDNDASAKILFAGQAKTDSPTTFNCEDWSSKTALPQAEWEALIKKKIGNCHMLIVLVGKNMATATGVAKEIQMAKDLDVPVFGVYVNGGGTSSTLPAGLPRNSVVAWKWDDIDKMIKQSKNLGKNARSIGWS